MRKSDEEVAVNIQTTAFAYSGRPKVLQFDNERVLISPFIQNLVKDWPGESAVINGCARHPQSWGEGGGGGRGLVERDNAKVEKMMACRCSHAQQ